MHKYWSDNRLLWELGGMFDYTVDALNNYWRAKELGDTGNMEYYSHISQACKDAHDAAWIELARRAEEREGYGQ